MFNRNDSKVLENISTSLEFIGKRMGDARKADRDAQSVMEYMTEIARDMRDIHVQAAARQDATPAWWPLAWDLYAKNPELLTPHQSISRAKAWLVEADRERFAKDHPEYLEEQS